MYSKTVNDSQLVIANRIFQQRYPKDELVYHSISEVNDWKARLEEIRGKDGQFTRDLSAEEDCWITNERMVCKINHTYALTRYCFIIDRNKKLSLFQPNLAQKIILSTLAEMEVQRLELIVQFVKARRLGVSTLFELLIALRILFDKNINAIISASNPEDTDVLSRMCLLAIERFPFWMRPLSTHLKDTVGRFKQGLFYEFHFGTSETAARNRIDLEHGTQFADIGRSQGPTANHLTEIAKYSNAGSLIDAGLMKAMIPSPMNLCCLEGTSEGPTGYWPEKWDFNVKNYGIPGSGARMRPTFLPWFCLAPHSLVVVGDGMVKPISEIVAGEMVKTHSGKLARVKTAIRTPRTNELTSEIWVWGSPTPLSCTRDHPVLTPNGWMGAAEVHAGDYVIHPIRKINEERKTFDLNLVHKGSSLKHPVNRTMPFSFEWGRFLGLYLAEGSLGRTRKHYAGGRSKMYIGGVSIACHSNEVEEFSEIIRRAVGYFPGVSRRTTGLGAELRVNDASLGRWMEEHFGHRDQKRIPDWVWTCGRDFCRGLVAGYLEGDGHIANYKLEIAARSVRLQLHIQLRDLIASLGYGWSAITYFRPEGKMKGDRGGWYLNIRTECAEALRRDLGWLVPQDVRFQVKPRHWRYCNDKQSIAIEVDRNLDGFSAEFYDLEIDDPDHSFVTPQCAVHNCGVEIYPTETDLITKGWYQVCDTWEPEQKTIDHARHAREYVLSDPMLKRFLAKGQDDWQMSREQQFFFEADIKEYRKNNNLHIWLREMAPDARSCWAAGEKSVFNADMLMKYRDATAQPLAIFGLKGMCGTDEIVAKRHHVLGARYKEKSLRVTADWTKRYAPFEFEFYPVKFAGWNGFDETGKIVIFEWPKPGETYALAADNADGRGGDSSVLKVLRKGGMGRCDAEAASFASSGISGTELWPWTLALGTLYSVMRDGKLQQPVFIPEINREGGGQLVKEMDYRGWKNFYKERRGRATTRGKGTIMLGWHMNEQNRAELILRGIQAIEDEWIEINSPAVVDEMDVFIRHTNGRIAAAKHRHDDHIISMFLAFWALYHDQVRGTGPDPTIQRSRPVSDDALFPLAEEGIGSQISRHIDEMITERGWSL